MLKHFLFILFAILVTALVSEYYAFKKQSAIEKKYRQEISVLKRDKDELENLKSSAEQELGRAKLFIHDLEEWKKKAIQCNPEIEVLVRFKQAKKEAETFLAQYPAINSIEATYTNYPLLVKIINTYMALSDEAKTQTNINLEFLKNQRDLAFADYIRTTTEYMQNADSKLEGIPEHLPQLTQIMEWFNGIPVAVRSEISGNVIISLSMKEAHAKYLTGLAVEAHENEDYPMQNQTLMNRFFLAINATSQKIKKNLGKWFKEKKEALKDWATTPFSHNFPEDVCEEDELLEEKPQNE